MAFLVDFKETNKARARMGKREKSRMVLGKLFAFRLRKLANTTGPIAPPRLMKVSSQPMASAWFCLGTISWVKKIAPV